MEMDKTIIDLIPSEPGITSQLLSMITVRRSENEITNKEILHKELVEIFDVVRVSSYHNGDVVVETEYHSNPFLRIFGQNLDECIYKAWLYTQMKIEKGSLEE